MFENIPAELRALPQWVVWRLEFRPPMLKPTKVPYTPRPNSGKANIVKSNTWGSFEQASSAPLNSKEPVDPDEPIAKTGFTGIGFVFSDSDPYCGIDLDDTHGDMAAYQHQLTIYNKFNSYTEYSPSRKGVHIIVRGKVPTGRRRNCIELYPQARFFTMTGDVMNAAPIAERQEALTWLYNEMGGDVKQYTVEADPVQNEEDEAVLQRGMTAVNGEKFRQLWEGNWQHLYPSQSEADFALVDMIAFYTKHIPQIMRLFRQSMLGQRDKAKRDDYIMYMVEKSFDRTLPPIDFDVFAKARLDEFHRLNAAENVAAGAFATEPGKRSSAAAAQTAATALSSPSASGEGFAPLPDAAPRPAYELAFAGAVGFMAGITGRAYNTPTRAGLNQYILMLAQTGIGKDAVASGTSKLINAMLPVCPSIVDFKGPGQLVSSAGLIKWLDRKPCIFSIVGEFGKMLKSMVAPNANAHLVGLSRTILELYTKSGHNEQFDPMAYSDKEKNTATIKSPSFTLFGESVPESFYEALDETMIVDGLLPRFLVFENREKRAYFNKNAALVDPSLDLVTRLNDLAAHCLGVMHRQSVHMVQWTFEAEQVFEGIDVWTTDSINQTNGEVTRELWNRVHLKAVKLASLLAVGRNYLNPCITDEDAIWAINLVMGQTKHLIAKFESGLVGGAATTGEVKQMTEVCKAIREFLDEPDKYIKYGGRQDMIANGVITEAAIQRKTACLACFRHDRMGQKFALKRALSTLLESDDLREIPPAQMQATYGSKPRAFCIANPKKFTTDLFN
jgi:hypothetical protein